MSKKERQAKISFSYDRLWEQKLSQVYHLLIPINNEIISTGQSGGELKSDELKKESAYENSGYIYESVFGSTKGE